jgi:hypothetical protein
MDRCRRLLDGGMPGEKSVAVTTSSSVPLKVPFPEKVKLSVTTSLMRIVSGVPATSNVLLPVSVPE